MSGVQLTEGQRRAIEERGRSILVSAAAGSGKTSVLSQRVAALVEEGTDIRRILVCTFTNAAASEMRARIGREIEAAAARAGSERLSRQAEYVAAADICTMHAFGIKLCAENFMALGIPSRTRIIADDEVRALRARAIRETFDALYMEEDADFLHLREIYFYKNDKALAAEILRLYAYISSKADGFAWLGRAGQAGNEAALFAALRELAGAKLELAAQRTDARIAICENSGAEKQLPIDLAERENIGQLLALLESGDIEQFDAALAGIAFARANYRGAGEAEKERMKQLRAEAKKLLGEVAALPLGTARQRIRQEAAYFRELAGALLHVTERFAAQYAARKRERRAMDFDDVFRFAGEILADEALRQQYAGRYDYVFIDEFQDTNPLQDDIFSLVSSSRNRFMVGDIKQSIYRFRLADPMIFLKKTREFEQESAEKSVIRMNENFRSAPAVIHAVNYVMRQVMSRQMGEIEYTEQERLIPRGAYDGYTELLLTEDTALAGPGETEPSPAEKEAHTIARRILTLLEEPIEENGKERPTQPEDIAILMRKAKGIPVFAQVLEQYGIPVQAEDGSGGGESELDVFVNLLRIVDCGADDVALLSVMRSHVGGFAEEDMAAVRAAQPDGAFWEAARICREQSGPLGGRLAEFFGKIERWRLMARNFSLCEFLITLERETNFKAYVTLSRRGMEKAQSFELFFNTCLGYAKDRESLGDLLNLLGRIRAEGPYVKPAAGGSGGAVRIMTIHKSKGLEFPVVILAMTGSAIRDGGEKLLLHSELGIAADIAHTEDRTEEKTLSKQIFRYVLRKEGQSEEVRILYVAMTRAKNKLLLSGFVKNAQEACAGALRPLAWMELLSAKSMLDWLLAACMRLRCFGDWLPDGESVERAMEDVDIRHTIVPAAKGGAPVAQAQSHAAERLRQAMEVAAAMPCAPLLHYDALHVPVKVGVSSLLGEFSDGWKPAPIQRGQLTGAALGTAAHLFLQHFDLSARGEEAVLAQLRRLEERRVLTPAEAEAVRPFAGRLAEFAISDLAYRIRRARRVYREQPFSMAVPARRIFPESHVDTPIVVQGIIDVAFEEEDGIVILDYKSNLAGMGNLAALASHYSRQMDMYEEAMRLATGLAVKEKYLYFLRLGKFVQIS